MCDIQRVVSRGVFVAITEKNFNRIKKVFLEIYMFGYKLLGVLPHKCVTRNTIEWLI